MSGGNLASNVPEIVLANAHLLDDRLQELSGKVRDIHKLATSIILPERQQVGVRDDPSQALHFTGVALSHKSTQLSTHFSSIELRALAVRAIYQNLPTLSSNIDTNDFEVFKFTAASIGGEQVTSLAYTLLDVY